MFRIRFSKKEVETPLSTAQMTAQLGAITNEADVESGMLKTFKQDGRSYYLSYPQAELEPGLTPVVRRAGVHRLLHLLARTFTLRKRLRGRR